MAHPKEVLPVPRNLLLAGLAGFGLVMCTAVLTAEVTEPAESGPKVVRLVLQPEAVALENARDARHVVVLGLTDSGTTVDLTQQAEFLPDQAIVQQAEDGAFEPVREGFAKVTVRAAGAKANLPVVVRSMDQPQISFVREVMPIFSKMSCNAGTCHGAQKGKNGFRMSLRGYDPEFDHQSLVDDLSGRRFNRAAPEQSLMLLKPSQQVPHQGGYVVEPASREYKVLKQWVTEGARFDGQTSRPDRLEIMPSRPELADAGARQKLAVIAHYPDESTRDVTREAVYASTVTDVATVTPQGKVTAVRRGESQIVVRYEGQFGVASVTVMGDRTGFKWAEVPGYNYIDTLVYKKLKRLKILPSELSSDAEFIRRVYLDLTGLPPSPEEVRRFLADPAESREKRERLIDQLLDTPEYVENWTNKWADLLQCNKKFLGDKGVWTFRNWIRQSVASNEPYDQFVQELLTSVGSTNENPPASYLRITQDPSEIGQNVTQLFMGVRFQCNKCHDHPFERWTWNQHYEFAAFFAQVGVKKGLAGDQIVYERRDGGEVKHPKTGEVVSPVFPVAHSGKLGQGKVRRQLLASWLTSPENPFFAKSMANRIWSYFLGKGIIDPVDDIRSSNPPSNPELLNAMTEDFIHSGFDVKHLMRRICKSRTYQHAIGSNRWNVDDHINFSHAMPRRLTAEQLYDAIYVVTGATPKFPGIPVGFRAAQLPDAKGAVGEFFNLFGTPPRESPCECERSSEVSLGQTLNLINGPTIAEAISNPNGRIARLMKNNPDERTIVEELYLAVLNRPPREDELHRVLPQIAATEDKTEAAQDLMWALINTPAFLFNR